MECKGIVCRADVYHAKTPRGLILDIRLNKLKRKSCTGCEKCDWISAALSEVSNDWRVLGMGDVEHGKLYKIKAIARSIDDYEIEVVEEEE